MATNNASASSSGNTRHSHPQQGDGNERIVHGPRTITRYELLVNGNGCIDTLFLFYYYS